MSQLVELKLPIRLQCLRVPIKWSFETKKGIDGPQTTLFFAVGSARESAGSFDPWEKRKEFQKLKEGDSQALAVFLDSVGLFQRGLPGNTAADVDRGNFRYIEGEDGSHLVMGSEFPNQTAKDIWRFRKVLIREMTRPTRGKGFDVWDLSCRLAEMKAGPSAIVTTFSFQDAMAAAGRIDELMRAQRQKCLRGDCPVFFSKVGKREKNYCCWECAHLETVRRGRQKKGKKR